MSTNGTPYPRRVAATPNRNPTIDTARNEPPPLVPMRRRGVSPLREEDSEQRPDSTPRLERVEANPAKKRRGLPALASVPTADSQDSRTPLATLSVNVSQRRRRQPVGSKTEEPYIPRGPLKSSSAEVLPAVLDDGTPREAPPTNAENGEDEDELWAELFYDDNLPSADDDFSDSDDEEGSPLPQDDNSPGVAHFAVDRDGSIRVGPQPLKERPFIVSKQYIDTLIEELRRHLLRRPVAYKNGRVYAVDDYTGLDLSWAPGRPDVPSMEAMYPFAIGSGQVLYHSPVNVGFVATSLNWLKRRHPIIVLALLGLWLRVLEDPNFERRKAALAWVYTALLNTGVMGRVFRFNQPHKEQVEEWQKLPREQLQAMLVHGRTGTYGPVIQAALDGKTLDQLFLNSDRSCWRKVVQQVPNWNVVYQWLIKIATKYGLSQGEFDYLFTLPAPASSRSNCRVFYPYYVLSRPQAQAMLWDWPCLLNVADRMLENMRRACNKYAEAKGYGEPEMSPLRLIYWWGHHLCKKVQAIKAQQPPPTLEEIAYSIGDQWGFGVLPWTGNILKASLCKARDHGVAMRFGLNLPNNGQTFDPVEHWDFFLCTVTIDSQATNMAMRNFANGLWGRIRQMIMAVQPSHTHWRLDKDLGLRSWAGEFETELQPRQPPVLPYEMPLVPIDAWLDESTPPPPLQCTQCPNAGSFATPGLLVRHYQEQHSQELSTVSLVDPKQDKIDDAYWKERLACPHCAKPLTAGAIWLHIHVQHSDKPPVKYPCPDPSCDETFTYRGTRDRHVALKHADEAPARFACPVPGCNSSFSRLDDLNRHAVKHAGKGGGLRCPETGCDEAFAGSSDLVQHVKEKHPGRILCPAAGCHRSFTRRDNLQSHIKLDHPDPADQTKKVKFTCTEPGCRKSYASKQRLEEHVRLKHSGSPPVRVPCPKSGCNETFATARGADRHVKKAHAGDSGTV